MSVDNLRLPAKSLNSLFISFGVPAKHCFSALSKTVNVDNSHQVSKLIISSKLHRFPDRSLGNLTIAHQDINVWDLGLLALSEFRVERGIWDLGSKRERHTDTD